MKDAKKPPKSKVDLKALKKAGGPAGSAQGPSMKGVIPGKRKGC